MIVITNTTTEHEYKISDFKCHKCDNNYLCYVSIISYSLNEYIESYNEYLFATDNYRNDFDNLLFRTIMSIYCITTVNSCKHKNANEHIYKFHDFSIMRYLQFPRCIHRKPLYRIYYNKYYKLYEKMIKHLKMIQKYTFPSISEFYYSIFCNMFDDSFNKSTRDEHKMFLVNTVLVQMQSFIDLKLVVEEEKQYAQDIIEKICLSKKYFPYIHSYTKEILSERFFTTHFNIRYELELTSSNITSFIDNNLSNNNNTSDEDID